MFFETSRRTSSSAVFWRWILATNDWKFGSLVTLCNFARETVCKTTHGLWVSPQSSGSSRSQILSAAWLKDQRRSRASSVRASEVAESERRLP